MMMNLPLPGRLFRTSHIFWKRGSGRLLHPYPDPLGEIQDGVALDQPQNRDFFRLRWSQRTDPLTPRAK